MMWTRHKPAAAVTAAGVLAGLVTGALLVLSGCGRGTPAAAPTAQLRPPFTDGPVPSLNRVLAAKIRNIVYARPPTRLTHTDIVYLLPAEGGLSPFLAVVSSGYPP